MSYRLVIYLFLLLSGIPVLGFSQSEFSKDQIRKFKTIYQESKLTHPIALTEKEFLDAKTKHHLNDEAIKSIGQKMNAHSTLSTNENSFISELRAIQNFKKSEKEKYIKALCKKHDLKKEDYDTMLKQYNSSIIFQNQVCKQV